MFIEGINRLGEPIWRRRQILNVESVEGLRLSEVQIGERTLNQFHHAVLRLALPGEIFNLIDASEFYQKFNKNPRDYYVSIFLGMTDGSILFEEFLTDSEEAKFFERAVRPALTDATNILGHEPAILPLCKGRHAASPLWYAYPDSSRSQFDALGVTL